jgi:hypothetical protein
MNDDGKSDDQELAASPEELAAAARLRDALEERDRRDELPRIGRAPEESDELVLARALGHAFAPRDLEKQEHARIVAAALSPRQAKRRRTVVLASVSLGGALALAASVVLVLGQTKSASAPQSAAAPTGTLEVPAVLAATTLVPRSTEPLFVHEGRPLGRQGSARIDRIASARSGEYLQARLTRWGAR